MSSLPLMMICYLQFAIMFDSQCLLQLLDSLQWASCCLSEFFSQVSIVRNSRGIPKRADETENPEHPEMGNPNPEITYPKRLILGKFLRGNIPPLEAPQTNTRKNHDWRTRSFLENSHCDVFFRSTQPLKLAIQ